VLKNEELTAANQAPIALPKVLPTNDGIIGINEG